MSLSKYLKGIPPSNQLKALEAAANSIYLQHLELLRGLYELTHQHQQDRLNELSLLQEDADEILALNVLRGHAANKLAIVSRLNVCREITVQRLGKRDAAKAKALNFTDDN